VRHPLSGTTNLSCPDDAGKFGFLSDAAGDSDTGIDGRRTMAGQVLSVYEANRSLTLAARISQNRAASVSERLARAMLLPDILALEATGMRDTFRLHFFQSKGPDFARRHCTLTASTNGKHHGVADADYAGFARARERSDVCSMMLGGQFGGPSDCGATCPSFF
jgi:hypothetical protein